MADSNITVSGLVAKPGIQQIKLEWSYSDPNANGLPYLALDAVEVWSATANNRADGSFAKVGEGKVDFVHGGVPEEITRYYWIKARNRSGFYGDWYPSGATSGVAGKAIGMAGLNFSLANGELSAVIDGSDNLVVSIKTAAGNTPSTTDPVFMAFPKSSAGVGGYQVREIVAALSLTLPAATAYEGSGGFLLQTGPYSLYLVVFDNAGSLVPAIINCNAISLGYIAPLSGDTLASTTTSPDSGVFYADTAISDKPYRVIGRLTWNSGNITPDHWTAPDTIRLHGLDSKLPGEVAQEIVSYVGRGSDIVFPTSTKIPFDATIPQWSEGEPLLNLGIVPTSPANVIEIEVIAPCSFSTTAKLTLSAFRDSNSDFTPDSNDAVSAAWHYAPGTDLPVVARLFFRDLAKQTVQILYVIRIGSNVNGTLYLAATSAGTIYNDTQVTWYKIREIVA